MSRRERFRRRSVRRAATWVRSGRHLAGRVSAANRVAPGSAGPHEHVAALSRGAVLRFARRLPQGVEPCAEVGFGFGDDIERHVRVLEGRRIRRHWPRKVPGRSACIHTAVT